MQRDVRACADGALGGLVGTAVMSLLMLAARQLGLMGELPPGRITKAALAARGQHQREQETEIATTALLHTGFGVGAGALFGVLHRRLRVPLAASAQGLIFGTLVWFVSYKGLVPALDIMPAPEHDRPDRPIIMVLAHWLYGAVLGLVVTRRGRAAMSG